MNVAQSAGAIKNPQKSGNIPMTIAHARSFKA